MWYLLPRETDSSKILAAKGVLAAFLVHLFIIIFYLIISFFSVSDKTIFEETIKIDLSSLNTKSYVYFGSKVAKNNSNNSGISNVITESKQVSNKVSKVSNIIAKKQDKKIVPKKTAKIANKTTSKKVVSVLPIAKLPISKNGIVENKLENKKNIESKPDIKSVSKAISHEVSTVEKMVEPDVFNITDQDIVNYEDIPVWAINLVSNIKSKIKIPKGIKCKKEMKYVVNISKNGQVELVTKRTEEPLLIYLEIKKGLVSTKYPKECWGKTLEFNMRG